MREILESHPISNLKAELRKLKTSLNYSKLKKAELINLMMKPNIRDNFKHLKMYVKPERKKPERKPKPKPAPKPKEQPKPKPAPKLKPAPKPKEEPKPKEAPKTKPKFEVKENKKLPPLPPKQKILKPEDFEEPEEYQNYLKRLENDKKFKQSQKWLDFKKKFKFNDTDPIILNRYIDFYKKYNKFFSIQTQRRIGDGYFYLLYAHKVLNYPTNTQILNFTFDDEKFRLVTNSYGPLETKPKRDVLVGKLYDKPQLGAELPSDPSTEGRAHPFETEANQTANKIFNYLRNVRKAVNEKKLRDPRDKLNEDKIEDIVKERKNKGVGRAITAYKKSKKLLEEYKGIKIPMIIPYELKQLFEKLEKIDPDYTNLFKKKLVEKFIEIKF